MKFSPLRIGIAIFGAVAFFAMENDPQEVSSNLCKWTIELAAVEQCPAWMNNPDWLLLFRCALGIVGLCLIWPLIPRGLAQLYDAWLFLTRGLFAIRKGARRVVVATMEKIKDEPVLVDENRAVKIIERSQWARYRNDMGKKPKSVADFFADEYAFSRVDNPRSNAEHSIFWSWCERVLKESFTRAATDEHDDNYRGGMVTTDEGEKLFSERILLKWLDDKWTAEMLDRFGKI
ncbi:hypothetical protein PB2503_02987 [Parvularcula bermudensis HTCC2503]|uniref:Uncharacterized protein n=2 Tax=Parvularcula TaxID=208215 RepID=E0TD15_PARBH|nr:hypothetical protein PB2503_02987 [Parvularcula bermudensis HTCC2503]